MNHKYDIKSCPKFLMYSVLINATKSTTEYSLLYKIYNFLKS